MACARLEPQGAYVVEAPEPVADVSSLLDRLGQRTGHDAVILLGVDFPIGLPIAYAQRVGISSFRTALAGFGAGSWTDFYTITASPTLVRPFYPPPSQVKGQYSRQQLATALGVDDLSELRRLCEHKTAIRKAAECLFFTMGGAQVGAGAIVGWRDLIQPALDRVRLWPFDGSLQELLQRPGVIISEIYPAEAYTHLGVQIGSAYKTTKTNRDHRAVAVRTVGARFSSGRIQLSASAASALSGGCATEDDFDALVGVLSMLLVVTGQQPSDIPDSEAIRTVEGWILGCGSTL